MTPYRLSRSETVQLPKLGEDTDLPFEMGKEMVVLIKRIKMFTLKNQHISKNLLGTNHRWA